MRLGALTRTVLALVLGVGVSLLLAGLIASYSFALAGVFVLAIGAATVSLGHNYEPFGAMLRKEDDEVLFSACESGMLGGARRFYRHLPASPRCRVCLVPFGGVGRLLRISPSRKNPNFCTSCIDTSPEGVHDMEIGVLFADIRGFTAWSATQPAAEAAERVSHFYDVAGGVLMQDDALIEFVGDQVMALYMPAFPSLRARTAEVMFAAAERLVSETQRDARMHPLRIGVGLNLGVASIGNIRKGGQKDFTAVGDVVNTASRLQAAAGPGEIIAATAVVERLASAPAGSEPRLLEVKGKSEALAVHVVPAK